MHCHCCTFLLILVHRSSTAEMQIKAVAEAHVVITNHGTAQHTTHTFNIPYHTPYHNTHSLHTPSNTHNAFHPLNPPYQPTFSTPPSIPPSHHTLSTHPPTHNTLGAFEGNLVYMRNGSLLIELCGNYDNDDFKLFQNYSREFGVHYRYQYALSTHTLSPCSTNTPPYEHTLLKRYTLSPHPPY